MRLLGGEVSIPGIDSEVLLPIKWNRRKKEYCVETAHEIWSSEDPLHFTWFSVTLQVGGDGDRVVLVYGDEFWTGWDGVTGASIFVSANALKAVLLRPGDMNSVTWTVSHT